MSRFTRHTTIVIISNLVSAVLSFILTALIARQLGEQALGQYSTILATIFPLTLAADFGISAHLTRTYSITTDAYQRDRLFRTAIWLRLSIASPLIAILYLVTSGMSDATLRYGLWLSAPLIAINPLVSTFTAVYRADGHFMRIALLTLGMLGLQVALTLLALPTKQFLLIVFINTLTSFVQLIVAIWTHPNKGDRRSAHTRLTSNELFSLWRAAWPFAIAGVLGALQMRLAFLVLANSAIEAGFFAAASKLMDVVKLAPNAVFAVLSPLLSANKPYTRLLFWRVMIGLGYYALLVAILINRFALTLLEQVFGMEFIPTTPTLLWLAFGLLPSLLRSGLLVYGYAKGHANLMNVLILINLVLFISLACNAQTSQQVAFVTFQSDFIIVLLTFAVFMWHKQKPSVIS